MENICKKNYEVNKNDKECEMKMLKRKYVLSIFIMLSLLVLGGLNNPAKANIPPTVDAGIDITISINDVNTTILYGFITDPDNTGFLKCAWENNLQQLTPFKDVVNSVCSVDLSSIANPGAGTYTLILYGHDGSVLASDSMILTILDSINGPIANAGADVTITTDQIDTTILQGTIINPYSSNDSLSCAWYENGILQLTPIMAVGPNGECPLDLSTALYIEWEIGSYTLVLYGLDNNVIYSDSMILTIIPPINNPATVEAGPDLVITSDEIAITTINGSVTDPDNTGTLLCVWEDISDPNYPIQITPITVVQNNLCPLDLINVINTSFEVGIYTLSLYGLDGSFISSDFMTLEIVQPNIAPVADAGENIGITTEQLNITIIQGSATDADGDPLTCTWSDGLTTLYTGTGSVCNLDLSTISIGIGTHSLFLEVSDGQVISADEMILTIDNSAPHAAPGGGGVYEVGIDVVLVGDVSDYDGDLLAYQWVEGSTEFCFGNIQAVVDGTPVMITDCIASNLSIGTHSITLRVDDGLNAPDSESVVVEIVDTAVPTLEPVASYYLLWPPNHVMVDIVIEANAVDNSGLLPTLSATVASNEPIDGLGDGDMSPDWTALSIDQTTGTISLQLRRERSGSGNGRIYTVTITATDGSGNSSTTTVDVRVPHDKKKK